MKLSLRFRDWPLRAKFAGLLAAVSVLPLGIAAVIDLQDLREQRIGDMQSHLTARAEQLSREFDSIHTGYLRSAQRVALQPALRDHCQAPTEEGARRLGGIFGAFPASDPSIRGLAFLNDAGTITVASDAQLVGLDVSSRSTVRQAMRGQPTISDVYVSTTLGRELPTVAYLVPIKDGRDRVRCIVAMWVHAETFWKAMRTAHERAGKGSFAVLYDGHGIRIGHSFRQEIVFRPSGRLDEATRREFVETRRFGARTAEFLSDVRPFPEQFDRARARQPDPSAFRGFASSNATWNYGVGSRLQAVPWTVFYMMPEAALQADLAVITRHKLLLALAMMALAVALGIAFAATIIGPVAALGRATARLAAGDSAARVTQPEGSDEIAQLGASFNAMAEKIERQAAELRKSHDELRLYANELEVANKDLEAFAFSVSHDLRAPLGVVNGFSQALANASGGNLDGKSVHYLGRIRAGVVQMEQLVDGILRLSRLGRNPVVKQPVELDPLVAEVLEQLRFEGVLSHHEVVVEGTLGSVFGDRVLIRQVFANLLSNACKFSAKEAAPRIEVGSEPGDGERIFYVRDNGAGFDKAYAHQLFEPFKRLHDAQAYAGLGVGLSIVQRIVQRHGGRVWAEGAVGAGACFYFSIANEAADPPPAGDHQPEAGACTAQE